MPREAIAHCTKYSNNDKDGNYPQYPRPVWFGFNILVMLQSLTNL